MKRKTAITGFSLTLILALIFIFYFQQHFKAVVVTGNSMLPTFKTGTKLWAGNAYWLIGDIRRNDIVVVREESGEGYFIKRVVALAGDTVDWRDAPRSRKIWDGDYKVPPGTVYVLGDNSEISQDSRFFGPVETNRILGKVVVRP